MSKIRALLFSICFLCNAAFSYADTDNFEFFFNGTSYLTPGSSIELSLPRDLVNQRNLHWKSSDTKCGDIDLQFDQSSIDDWRFNPANGGFLSFSTEVDGKRFFGIFVLSDYYLGIAYMICGGDIVSYFFNLDKDKTDIDADGLFNSVDNNASVPSKDFQDFQTGGGTNGELISKGGPGHVIVRDALANNKGIRLAKNGFLVEPNREAAEFKLCDENINVFVEQFETAIFNCGSQVTVFAPRGSPHLEFVAANTQVKIDLPEGTSVSIDPAAALIIADASNTNDIQIFVNNTTISLAPGESFEVVPRPAALVFKTQPKDVKVSELLPPLDLVLLDDSSEVFSSSERIVELTLLSSNPAAELLGTTKLSTTNGAVQFSNLRVSGVGENFVIRARTLEDPILQTDSEAFQVTGIGENTSFSTSFEARDVAYSAPYAYVVGTGLEVIDISVPREPQLVESLELAGTLHDIFLNGHLAFLASGTAGLQIVDLGDPFDPKLIGSFLSSAFEDIRKIVVRDNLAYLADKKFGLRIVDVSNPAAPFLVGKLAAGEVVDLSLKDDFAYLTSTFQGLKVIDISTPEAPALLTNSRGPNNEILQAVAISIRDNFAYIVDRETGLNVVSIGDPESPRFVRNFALTVLTAADIFLRGKHAFIATSNSNSPIPGEDIFIVDISNLAELETFSSYPSLGTAYGLSMGDKQLLIADGEAGLQIVDFILPRVDILEAVSSTLILPRADLEISAELSAFSSEDLPLSFSLEEAPQHGNVQIDNNGNYTYSTKAGFVDRDEFVFKVQDSQGNERTAKVEVFLDQAGNEVAFALDLGAIDREPFIVEEILNALDTDDFYRIILRFPANLTVTLSELAADVDFQLLDKNGNELFLESHPGNAVESLQLTFIEGGEYYLRVFSRDTLATSYKLGIAAQTDYGGPDPERALDLGIIGQNNISNSTVLYEREIEERLSFQGLFSDRNDVIRFELVEPATVRVLAFGAVTTNQDLVVDLNDSNFDRITSSTIESKNNSATGGISGFTVRPNDNPLQELTLASSVGNTQNAQAIIQRTLAAGAYFINVTGVNFSAPIDYKLSILVDNVGDSPHSAPLIDNLSDRITVIDDRISIADTNDYYRLKINSPGEFAKLDIRLSGLNEDLDLQLLGHVGIFTRDESLNTGTGTERISYLVSQGEELLLRVFPKNGNTQSSYKLELAIFEPFGQRNIDTPQDERAVNLIVKELLDSFEYIQDKLRDLPHVTWAYNARDFGRNEDERIPTTKTLEHLTHFWLLRWLSENGLGGIDGYFDEIEFRIPLEKTFVHNVGHFDDPLKSDPATITTTIISEGFRLGLPKSSSFPGYQFRFEEKNRFSFRVNRLRVAAIGNVNFRTEQRCPQFVTPLNIFAGYKTCHFNLGPGYLYAGLDYVDLEISGNITLINGIFQVINLSFEVFTDVDNLICGDPLENPGFGIPSTVIFHEKTASNVLLFNFFHTELGELLLANELKQAIEDGAKETTVKIQTFINDILRKLVIKNYSQAYVTPEEFGLERNVFPIKDSWTKCQSGFRCKAPIGPRPPTEPPTPHENSAPDLSDISHNAASEQVFDDTQITLQASASDADADTISWQWLFRLNGGDQVILKSGIGAIADQTFNFPKDSAPANYQFIIRADDGQEAVEKTIQINVVKRPVPPDPRVISNFSTPGFARDVAVVGNYAYVADSDALRIIDISDLNQPKLVSEFPVAAGTVYEVSIENGRAYLAAGTAGLIAVDVTDPDNPGSPVVFNNQDQGLVHGDDFRTVFAHDSAVYAVNLQTFDGQALQLISFRVPGFSQLDLNFGPASWGKIRQSMFVGDKLYFVSGPNDLGPFGEPDDTPGNGFYIYPEGGGLVFYSGNDSNTPNPFFTPLFSNPLDVFAKDDKAYVLDNNTGLQVLDVSDYLNPVALDSFELPASTGAANVFVHNSSIYINNGEIHALSLSEENELDQEFSVKTPGTAQNIFATKDALFVADGEAGLTIVEPLIGVNQAPSVNIIPNEEVIDEDLDLPGIQRFEESFDKFTASISDPDNSEIQWEFFVKRNSAAEERIASGSLTLINGEAQLPEIGYEYPADDAPATRTFILRVTDGAKSTEAQFVVEVIELPNRFPIFDNETYAVPLSQSVFHGNLFARDPDLDVLSFSKETEPSNGSVVVNSNGSFTYTPDPGYSGIDSFHVRVSDGELSAIAKIFMAVDGAGNSPDTAVGLGTLNANRSISDWVGAFDTDDYYEFALSFATEVSITLDLLESDIDFELYRRNGDNLEFIEAPRVLGSLAENITRTLAAGLYLVRVIAKEDSSYRLTIAIDSNPSTFVPSAAGPRSINKEPGANVPDRVAKESGFIFIQFKDNPERTCSGVLIRNNWAITARHCVTRTGKVEGLATSASNIEVRMGSKTNASARQVTTAVQVVPYEQIGNGLLYDIALLRLPEPTPFLGNPNDPQPLKFRNRPIGYQIPIFSDSDESLKGKDVWCYGYGLSGPRSPTTTTGQLRKVRLKVLRVSNGTLVLDNIKEGFGGSHAAVLKGDSGSTCLFEKKVKGIMISFITGINSEISDIELFQVAPSIYRDWVNEQIAASDSELNITKTEDVLANWSGALGIRTPAPAGCKNIAGIPTCDSQTVRIFLNKDGGEDRIEFDVTQLQDNGEDLRFFFFPSAFSEPFPNPFRRFGAIELPFHRVAWDPNGDSIVDITFPTDTKDIVMMYGNPNAPFTQGPGDEFLP